MHVEEESDDDDDDQSVIKRVQDDEGNDGAMGYDYEQEDSV